VDNIPEKFLLTLDNNNINEVIDFGEYVKKIEIFDKKWDGKINGEPLRAGVYIYYVEQSDNRKSYGVIYIEIK